jgi:hypothetical protein
VPLLGEIEGLPQNKEVVGIWSFDDDDFLLMALLQDPVYAAELMWDDPSNTEYGGCYVVRDYQYPLFRNFDNYAGFACARSVGKTESIKAKSFTHPFRRQRENLLVTAPELIHLLPLTDAIEERIRDTRLTREFLDTRDGATGFTHKPFGVNFLDGTKIVGRIPRLTGTGVKGQHQPDLLVDEAQDYPEKGWVEVHEAQPLDAQILTPSGHREMGDIRVGDYVMGVNGKTKVLDVLDHGMRDILAVEFSDGTVVECDADHWWTVERKTDRWKTRRASDLRVGDSVPDHGPLFFEQRDTLPIDPYTLGALIGDGCTTRKALYFSNGDDEVVERLRSALGAEEELVQVSAYDYRLRKAGPRSRHGRPRLVDAVEGLDLWGKLAHEKFIPPVYLHARWADRVELLEGLIDTDGNVDSKGAIRFSSCSERLRDDVEFLVRSLGGIGAKTEQEDRRGHRTMYCFRFRLPGGKLRLCKRKREKIKEIKSKRSYKRRIVGVRPAGKKPVRCIEVEANDGLYLTENFIPTHNTVMKDRDDFTYHFYGVHSGARDSGFYKRVNEGGFTIVQVTAMQRPGWSAEEKRAAKAAYGGTSAPDYRRNILGEAGAAASAFFVTARLFACVDQDRESHYNQYEYVHQELRVEEVDELEIPLAEIMDLPSGLKVVYGGADLGLNDSPTVMSLFSLEKTKVEQKEAARERLKLVRRYTLERFRSRQIREALFAIAWALGPALKGFGIDSTGLGLPVFQDMQDDEACPEHLRQVARGYFFNSKLPVKVDPQFVTKDGLGRMRDQYGSAVKEEEDPISFEKRLVTYMTMIEASTRYLREWVDTSYLLLPFDPEITTDMQGETVQRVTNVAKLTGMRKPNAFHILDSFRGMAMAYHATEVEQAMEYKKRRPVFDEVVVV